MNFLAQLCLIMTLSFFFFQIPASLSPGRNSEESLPAAQNEWILGVSADLTLGAASAGLSIVNGARVAADELNRRGGILGQRVRVLALDHGGINQREIANIKLFARQKNLLAVIGGIHSNVIIAALDIIHQEKIPFLVPWAGAVEIIDNGRQPNFVFRLGARDEYVAEFLVQQAIKKSKKISLLLESSVWGRSNLHATIIALAKRNLTPLTVQWVDRSASEVNLQIANIVASGTRVLIMVLNSPESVLVVRTLAERAQDVVVLSHWGITSHNFFDEAKSALNKVDVEFFQPFSFGRLPVSQKTKILNLYRESIGFVNAEDIRAPAGFAHAYDLTHIVARAKEKVGRGDRSELRNALEQMSNYQGLSRTFMPVFTPQRHEALDPNSYFLAKYDENGHIRPVGNHKK